MSWCEAPQAQPVTASLVAAGDVDINRSALSQQGCTFLCLQHHQAGAVHGLSQQLWHHQQAQPSWLFPQLCWFPAGVPGTPGCRSQLLPATWDTAAWQGWELLALAAFHSVLSLTDHFWGRASPQPQGFGEIQLCSRSRQCSFAQTHPVNVCSPHSELLGIILWDISRTRWEGHCPPSFLPRMVSSSLPNLSNTLSWCEGWSSSWLCISFILGLQDM